MTEKTFVMIKPRHVHLAKDIFKELDAHGTRIKLTKVDEVPEEVITEHYNFLKDKPFFKGMIDLYMGKTVVIAIYEGKDIIKKFSDLIGPTDPKEAKEHTIRYRHGLPHSKNVEERKRDNVIHRSDSKESFEREAKVWKKHL